MTPKILPPTYCFIYLVAAIILHLLLPISQIIPSPLNLLGVVPFLFGIMINVWADKWFKQIATEVKSFGKPSTLVTQGPFRFSRHPMYLGFVMVLLGVAVLLGSLTAFVAPVAIFLTLAVIFIPFEEKMCEDTFGQEYLDYKTRVRRWF